MLFEHVKEAIEGTFTESRLVWCNVSRVVAFLSVFVEKLMYRVLIQVRFQCSLYFSGRERKLGTRLVSELVRGLCSRQYSLSLAKSLRTLNPELTVEQNRT